MKHHPSQELAARFEQALAANCAVMAIHPDTTNPIDRLLSRVRGLREKGFPVRVRVHGLVAAAVINPAGRQILEAALEVLEFDGPPAKRYDALDLLLPIETRIIAKQLFPDCPAEDSLFFRHAPDWLLESLIEGPA